MVEGETDIICDKELGSKMSDLSLVYANGLPANIAIPQHVFAKLPLFNLFLPVDTFPARWTYCHKNSISPMRIKIVLISITALYMFLLKLICLNIDSELPISLLYIENE